MPFKRVLLLIGVVFALTGAALAGAYHVGKAAPPYYNCLRLANGVRVQLNTHLYGIEKVVSTSPDGNYRLLRWEYGQTVTVAVEDMRSGQRHIVESRNVEPDQYFGVWGYWSPTSTTLLLQTWIEGEPSTVWRLVDVRSGHATIIDYENVTFSPRGEVIFAPQGHRIALLSTRTFEPVMRVELSETVNSCNATSWSPTDNRVACSVETFPTPSLVIIDPDQQRYSQTPLPPYELQPTASLQLNVRVHVDWSPDGKYLSAYVTTYVENPPRGVPALVGAKIYFFTLNGVDLTLLDQIDFEMAGWVTGSLALTQYNGTFANAHEYVYVQAPESVTYPHYNMVNPVGNLELWQFDFDTGQHEQLVTGIRQLKSNGDTLLLLRDDNYTTVLELRDKDGRNPRLIDVGPTPMVHCIWYGVDTFHCWTAFHTFRIFDEQGKTLWPIDNWPYTGTSLYNITTSPTARFLIGSLKFPDGSRGAVLVDNRTQQVHELPEQPRYVATEWGYPAQPSIQPWPGDDNSWMVYFWATPATSAWFRFWPKGNIWQPVTFLSPDGARGAYTATTEIPLMLDVFVQDTDSAREWHLGSFPAWMLYNMEWTQCGDALAPLRDRLAAESP